MQENSWMENEDREFGEAYRQGFADALALQDAVLEFDETRTPRRDTGLIECYGPPGLYPVLAEEFAEEWVYQAAVNNADGDARIGRFILGCAPIRYLLESRDYPSAIEEAATLAYAVSRLAPLLADLAEALDQEEDFEDEADWGDVGKDVPSQ